MQDYNKNSFWTAISPEDQIKHYFIRINSQYIEVPREVYTVCFNSYQKELDERKRLEKYKVYSLDQVNADGHDLYGILGFEQDPIQEISIHDQLVEVKQEIEKLPNQDKKIMTYSLLEFSEREIAEKLGLPQRTVNYRKNKILKILREKLRKIEK